MKLTDFPRITFAFKLLAVALLSWCSAMALMVLGFHFGQLAIVMVGCGVMALIGYLVRRGFSLGALAAIGASSAIPMIAFINGLFSKTHDFPELLLLSLSVSFSAIGWAIANRIHPKSKNETIAS